MSDVVVAVDAVAVNEAVVVWGSVTVKEAVVLGMGEDAEAVRVVAVERGAGEVSGAGVRVVAVERGAGEVSGAGEDTMDV